MDKLHDCEFVSKRYGVALRTVWEWIRIGKLPAVKIGKQYRVAESDLIAFENSSRTIKPKGE